MTSSLEPIKLLYGETDSDVLQKAIVPFELLYFKCGRRLLFPIWLSEEYKVALDAVRIQEFLAGRRRRLPSPRSRFFKGKDSINTLSGKHKEELTDTQRSGLEQAVIDNRHFLVAVVLADAAAAEVREDRYRWFISTALVGLGALAALATANLV